MLYRSLIRPLLFTLPPETVHHLAFGALRLAAATPGVGRAMRAALRVRHPSLEVEAFGRRFAHPIGLAAGFDKDAVGIDALGAIGFGHVEVGTLTAHAQPGNPRPRMFRLARDRAILNRMGFNNAGSAAAVPRLARERDVIVGVNIGKSKVTPAEEAAADYAISAERVARYADYLVVNVSSPNTPGLRDLQAVAALRPILEAVQRASDASGAAPPLLVKIAPDLANDDVDRVADLALELGLDGIVATNTTISRAGLRTAPAVVEALGAGGISGAPLKARALEVLTRLRRRVGERLVLVAAGGVEDADDAWARITAGATLVQIYTGFVYGGPFVVRTIADGLRTRVAAAGLASIGEAVGMAHARSRAVAASPHD